MTRDQEIASAAEQYVRSTLGRTYGYDAFISGAKWADEHNKTQTKHKETNHD
jgi:hypothetical protein